MLPENKELEAGQITVAEQARKLGCAENTIYLWKKKYGGLEVNDVKELRELRQENNKLKQMVANLMLEKEAIAEALKKL
ncbi:MAG: transposase [Vampirovibrionales bacterium]|nr:transposase [Vampirovibrionales bacterium]